MSVKKIMNGENPAFSVSMSDEQVRVCTGAVVDHDILIGALTEISNMCIGNLTMNYSLDSQYIGELIYRSTGLTNPELNEFVGQLEGESNE